MGVNTCIITHSRASCLILFVVFRAAMLQHETPHQQRRDSVAHAADLRRWNENHRTKSFRLGQKDSHAFACFANAGVKALCTSVHLQHPLCKENWA